MMKPIRTLSGIAALVLAVLVGGWLVFATPGQADDDQSALASLISRLLTTPTTRVSIGDIDGALSSTAVISNITISDEEGPWLRLDRVSLDWSRASLLRRRLQVNALDIGTVEYLRPAQTPPQEQDAAESGPLFPELPLEVRIDAFNLDELIVGAPVLGKKHASPPKVPPGWQTRQRVSISASPRAASTMTPLLIWNSTIFRKTTG
ncbi:hypothetical protein [Saliniramus fredricksonii]|uniref:hypothetical protein n=1 Tax=Saliniramus fredricksonii TaxID=1653334 RepID=UPI0009F2D9EA|nr:hypothetical protein [Saliniramus fredricksonii]